MAMVVWVSDWRAAAATASRSRSRTAVISRG
jgi:hypothetical protein